MNIMKIKVILGVVAMFALQSAMSQDEETITYFYQIPLEEEVFSSDDPLGVAALRNVTSLTNAFQSKVDQTTGERTTTIIGDNITATGKVMKVTDNLVVGEGVNYSDHAFLTGHKAKASYGDLTAGTMGYVVIGVNPGGVAHTLKLDGDLSGIDLTKKYSLALSHFQISNQIEISNVVGQVVYLKKAYWGSDFTSELAGKSESYFWNMYNGEDDNGLYCPTDTSIGNTRMRNFKYQTAEGGSSKAIGKYSHAEGRYSIAEGRYSHAEGQLGFAGGVASHVEGQGGLTTGSCGHSEGINTEATSYAHAEGAFTKAIGNGSHAEGGWRASATEYAPGGQALASASHAEGVGTTAKGTGSHAEGYGNVANGVYSHAEGGYYSTSEVHTNIANGAASHVEGMETYISTSASCGHAEGYRSHSEGKYTHAEGQSTIAKGIASHAEGQSTQSNGTGSHAEGRGNVASGSYSHVEGGMVFDGTTYTNVASGTASHAEGYNTQALNLGTHTEGYGTIAVANRSHAEGHSTLANGDSSHAEGHVTIAQGGYSHAEGNGTSSDKEFKMFHIGGNSYTTTVDHALSPNTIIRMKNQIRKVTATPGARTITLNSVFSDLTTNDVIKVVTGVAYGEHSHTEGYSTLAIGNYSHAEGESTTASGITAHAEGISTKAEANASHAEGYGSKTSGDYSHAEGKDTFTKGTASHAEGIGYRTQVSSYKVFYNGTGNAYTSNVPHNLSINNIIEVNGQLRKVVEVPTNRTFVVDSKFSGTITNASVSIIHGIAYGSYSHSEGGYTYATAENSHAEGDHTKAYGKNSHAEGSYTTASGEASFAGGKQTTSTNTASFAEGFSTKAYGMYSHAGGWGSEAHTIASFAFGYMAKTSNNIGEIALGKNNISSSDTIFSVGTGSDARKKNGLEVKNNNDIYFWHNGQYVKLQDKISSIPSSVGITSVTTNGTSFSVNNGEVTIPLDNYVLKSEIKAQAQTAINSINSSANLSEIKAALTNFLQQTFVNQ